MSGFLTGGPTPTSGSSGGSGNTAGNFLGTLLAGSNPLLGGLMGLAGLFSGGSHLKNASRDIRDLAAFNPSGIQSPFGNLMFAGGTARFQDSPQNALIRAGLSGGAGALLGGGIFNDPILQSALQSNDLAGAFQGAQSVSDFGAGGLGALGFDALMQAQDQSGLINQQLEASRALAAPFENQARLQLFDDLNNKGLLSHTTGADFLNKFGTGLGLADSQRVLNAQTLGLNQQANLRNFGTGAIGQGFNQAMTTGQQRLQNAMGLFGLGTDTFANQFGLGLGAAGASQNADSLVLQAILGNLNAEANRIGATQGHAQAIGSLGSQRGSLFGSFFSGLGGLFG